MRPILLGNVAELQRVFPSEREAGFVDNLERARCGHRYGNEVVAVGRKWQPESVEDLFRDVADRGRSDRL